MDESARDGGKTHAQAVSVRRKDLQEKLLFHVSEYTLFNGLAITSMLSRVQGMFEDYVTDLAQDLEDQDYDDEETAPYEEIIKCIKIAGLHYDSFDEDIQDFIKFLAMRHSKSIGEIAYKDFLKAFEEDYSMIDDKKSIWDTGEAEYEASDDEGELESDKSPVRVVEETEPDDGQSPGQDGGRAS